MAEISGGNIRISRVASGNLDVSQWRFVTFSGKDVYLPATSGSIVLGVLENKPRDNEHATVIALGPAKIQVANSLGTGAYLMTGNSGFAVLATSGQNVVGYTITAATSGAIAEMIVNQWRVFGGNP